MNKTSTALGLQHETIGHFLIARGCLQVMLSTAPRSIIHPESLMHYALHHWVYHLNDSVREDISSDLFNSPEFVDASHKLQQSFSRFLENRNIIQSWVYFHYEHIATVSEGPIPFAQLRRWVSWLKQLHSLSDAINPLLGIVSDAAEFVNDLESLVNTWGTKLYKSPRVLWDETNLFLQSRFFCPNTRTQVTHLSSAAPQDEKQSSRSLCDISVTSSDGQNNGVLSVWPSKAYEKRWQSLGRSQSLENVKDVCDGWIAKYEVWDLRSKSLLASMTVALDAAEVWLLMRQSLHERDIGEWRLGFPMAICSDGRSFVVLRTLYSFNPSEDKLSATYEQAIIPTDFTTEHEDKWTEKLEAFDPNHPSIRDKPLKFIFRDRYTYSIAFSAQGKYIYFTDFIRNGFPCHTFAVFEILRQEKLKLQRVSAISRLGLSFHVALHPSEDLATLIDGVRCLIWKFREGILFSFVFS